ncbi:MAG: phosphatidate cytidylyltransferase, partial [Pseudorhodobacter sp.]|nr:phosphatidate cytidylyltransferase [Frankiaceae bacterium]
MTSLDEHPVTTPGRAGRNLPAAIGVGLGLGTVITATVFSPYRWTFAVLVAVAAVVGTVEIVRALRALGAAPPLPPLLAAGAAMGLLGYRQGVEAPLLAPSLTVLACVVLRSTG